MDLNETAVFVKVVQSGSFSRAARLLGLPTSTVSTRVSRLEKRLGMTLLQRTTRQLNLTEAGTVYFEHAVAGLDQILTAEAAITATHGDVTGLLRVTAPADIGDALLARLVNSVHQAYPKLRIDLMLMDRYVDLIKEGVDVAIRTGKLKDSSLIAKKIGTICWVLFASPDYLKSAPPLKKPQQLRDHKCLQFTRFSKEDWTISMKKGNITVPIQGDILVNDVDVIKAMVVAGQGVAMLPTYICHDEWKVGGLIRVLPGWQFKADPLYIVYPKQRFVSAKLRAFIDIATEELRALFGD